MRLAENLNSEAALGTVGDVAQCVQWLRSTFLYVRAAKDPKRYLGLTPAAPCYQISKKIEEMCVRAMNSLASAGLITMDEASCIASTEAGRLMSIFYLDLETMKLIMKLQGDETLEQLLSVICESHELADMHLRVDERRCLNALNRNNKAATIRFPMKGKISSRQMKLSCIIQAVLGCLPILDPSLNQEAMKIMRVAVRICKCLVAYVTRPEVTSEQREFFNALLNSLVLAKCVEAHLWENSHFISKQLKGIGPTFSTLLASAGKVTFLLLEESHPRDLERIMNKGPPAGNIIRKQISLLPKYQLETTPIDEKTVSIQLRLLNQAYLSENIEDLTAGNAHKCYVIAGDSKNNIMLFKTFKDTDLISVYNGIMTFEITRNHTFEHKLYVHCISATFVGIDARCEYTFMKQMPTTSDISSFYFQNNKTEKNLINTNKIETNERKRKNDDNIMKSKEKKKRENEFAEKCRLLKKSFDNTSNKIKNDLRETEKKTKNTLKGLVDTFKPDLCNKSEAGLDSNKDYFNELASLDNNLNIDDFEDPMDSQKINSLLNDIESEIIGNNQVSYKGFNEVKTVENKKQTRRNEYKYKESKQPYYKFIELLERNVEMSEDEEPPEKQNGFSETIKDQLDKYLQISRNVAISSDPIVSRLCNDEQDLVKTQCNSVNVNTEVFTNDDDPTNNMGITITDKCLKHYMMVNTMQVESKDDQTSRSNRNTSSAIDNGIETSKCLDLFSDVIENLSNEKVEIEYNNQDIKAKHKNSQNLNICTLEGFNNYHQQNTFLEHNAKIMQLLPLVHSNSLILRDSDLARNWVIKSNKIVNNHADAEHNRLNIHDDIVTMQNNYKTDYVTNKYNTAVLREALKQKETVPCISTNQKHQKGHIELDETHSDLPDIRKICGSHNIAKEKQQQQETDTDKVNINNFFKETSNSEINKHDQDGTLKELLDNRLRKKQEHKYKFSSEKVYIQSKFSADNYIQIIRKLKIDLDVTETIIENKITPESSATFNTDNFSRNTGKNKSSKPFEYNANTKAIMHFEPDTNNLKREHDTRTKETEVALEDDSKIKKSKDTESSATFNTDPFCRNTGKNQWLKPNKHNADTKAIMHLQSDTNNLKRERDTRTKEAKVILMDDSEIEKSKYIASNPSHRVIQSDNHNNTNSTIDNLLNKYIKVFSNNDKNKKTTNIQSSNIYNHRTLQPIKTNKPFKITEIQNLNLQLSEISDPAKATNDFDAFAIEDINKNLLIRNQELPTSSDDAEFSQRTQIEDPIAAIHDHAAFSSHLPLYEEEDLIEEHFDVDQAMLNPKTLLMRYNNGESNNEIIPPPPEFCNSGGDYSPEIDDNLINNLISPPLHSPNYNSVFEDQLNSNGTDLTCQYFETWTLNTDDPYEIDNFNTHPMRSSINRNTTENNRYPVPSLGARYGKLNQFRFHRKNKLKVKM
ncbi:hypothetical protein evm_005837 [Chilo suppressalis]|nr:hypothetical protein evm_005837 [Chilo suppressalis]